MVTRQGRRYNEVAKQGPEREEREARTSGAMTVGWTGRRREKELASRDKTRKTPASKQSKAKQATKQTMAQNAQCYCSRWVIMLTRLFARLESSTALTKVCRLW